MDRERKRISMHSYQKFRGFNSILGKLQDQALTTDSSDRSIQLTTKFKKMIKDKLPLPKNINGLWAVKEQDL